jgi:hypothetical protein
MNKSILLCNELVDDVNTQLELLFPMNIGGLYQGVRYLGFMLKPNDYHMIIIGE